MNNKFVTSLAAAALVAAGSSGAFAQTPTGGRTLPGRTIQNTVPSIQNTVPSMATPLLSSRASTTMAPLVPSPFVNPNSTVAPSAATMPGAGSQIPAPLPGGGSQVPASQGSGVGTSVPMFGTANTSEPFLSGEVGLGVIGQFEGSPGTACSGVAAQSDLSIGLLSTMPSNCISGGSPTATGRSMPSGLSTTSANGLGTTTTPPSGLGLTSANGLGTTTTLPSGLGLTSPSGLGTTSANGLGTTSRATSLPGSSPNG